MRMGEENIVVPLDSPKRPPATSYAAVRSSFPCLSLYRVGPARQPSFSGGSQRGPRRVWAMPACVSWAVGSIRASLAVE